MAYRNGGGSRAGDFPDRGGGGGGGGGGYYDPPDRAAYYDAPARAPAPVRDYQDVDVRVMDRDRERDRDRDRESRVPAFMRESARRSDAGQLVLRQRDVETVERPRRRSPSPVRVRDMRIMEETRSATPPKQVVEDDLRIRRVERERVRSPSRGPPSERIRTRYVERERERSPSPVDIDREHIRIVRRETQKSPTISSSPSPSPPPLPSPPRVIKGPTVEREVITHYRDIDHGVVAVRPPSPPPLPRPREQRNEEIDIYTSRNATEVDIHKRSRSRGRSRSPSRERYAPRQPPASVHDDEILVHSGRNHLQVDIDERRRRSHSAAPPVEYYHPNRHHRRDEDWDESEYLTSRINSRGHVGEAWHGATKDWSIVDVPPGTERVRMDGAGGGAAEVTWQKYNGVRRSKFIPERDETPRSSASDVRDARDVRSGDKRLSVQIYDRDREIDVERTTDRRVAPPPPPRPPQMWTEITKDLVIRDAIERMGYEYEETEFFFYVMKYLRYEDVLELVELSDHIRRARRDRVKEIQWERAVRDLPWDEHYHYHVHPSHRRRHGHRHKHGHSHSHSRSIDRESERIVEKDVVYESRPPIRGYLN